MSLLSRINIGLGVMVLGLSSAQALVIDYGDYITDDISGLDWRDMSTTINESKSHVTAQFASGGEYSGWRYASSQEVVTLVSNYAILPAGFSLDAETFILPPDSIELLISQLGATYGYSNAFGSGNGIKGIISDQSSFLGTPVLYYATLAHYGGSVFGPGKDSLYAKQYTEMAYSGNFAQTGSFLVRASIPKPPSAVPVPISIVLMVSGLTVLGFARRKRRLSA